MKRLPYRFCWWCSRQLWGKSHRARIVDGHDVVVHTACNDLMERQDVGEAKESPADIRAAEDAALARLTC